MFNTWRHDKFKLDPASTGTFQPHTSWPCTIFFRYGAATTGKDVPKPSGKEGWWGHEQLLAQQAQVMEMHEFIFPGRPAIYEFDHSSGHLKKAETGLVVSSMNVKFGGKQPMMHESLLTADSIGPNEAVLWENPSPPPTVPRWSKTAVAGWDRRVFTLKPGDVQQMVFTKDCPPLHYDPNFDRKLLLGQPVGKSQVAWLRGCHVDGMTDAGIPETGSGVAATPRAAPIQGDGPDALDPVFDASTDTSMDAHAPLDCTNVDWQAAIKSAMATKSYWKVLYACRDFATYPSLLTTLVLKSGDLLVLSPKYHPEVAGAGIEFCWGMSKKGFRKANGELGPSKCTDKTLHDRVRASLRLVKEGNVYAFYRLARRYRQVYLSGEQYEGFEGIKALVRKYKSHRNILDSHSSLLAMHLTIGSQSEENELDF
jgi:uncharacterized membrane protein